MAGTIKQECQLLFSWAKMSAGSCFNLQLNWTIKITDWLSSERACVCVCVWLCKACTLWDSWICSHSSSFSLQSSNSCIDNSYIKLQFICERSTAEHASSCGGVRMWVWDEHAVADLTFLKSCTGMFPVRVRSDVRKLRLMEVQDERTTSWILSMTSTQSLLRTPWLVWTTSDSIPSIQGQCRETWTIRNETNRGESSTWLVTIHVFTSWGSEQSVFCSVIR